MKIPDSLNKAAQQCTASYNAFVEFFQATPALIDRRWRWMDFKLNRNYGGILGRKLAMDGYSVISLGLPVLAMFFLVGGPMVRARGHEAAAIYVAFVLALVFLWRWIARRQEGQHREWNSVAVLQLGLRLLVILVVWFCSTTSRPGMECRLYRHSFLVLGALLYVVMLPVAWLLARRLFRKEEFAGIDFRSALEHTELFRNPGMPNLTVGAIMRALVNAPIQYLPFLLFVPSVVVVFTPPAYRDWLPFLTVCSFVAAWIVLSFPSFHERIRAVVELTRRCLFVGGQLVVSLAIIVLAIGRLAEFGYIATVVEASGPTILLYVVCSYAIFWLYEYWMNRVLTERVLRFFLTNTDPIGCTSYSTVKRGGSKTTRAEECVLQIHGAARLIVVGGSDRHPIFEPYERAAFFDAIATANPALKGKVEDIKNKMKFYLSSLNILLVLIAAGLAWKLSTLPQIPQVSVAATEPQSSVDLRSLIFDRTGGRQRGHVILLAASGGGTRAALYTASVLHGLADQRQLDNLVLASGVSGGGAALAYFAAHHDELKTRSTGWKEYYEAMSKPFIQEVLEGASEWRINGGVRLGRLLEESFARHLRLTNAVIGQCTDFGLILNTALAGHLWQDSDLQEPFASWANDHRRLTRSDPAGGRLIFTNLRDRQSFPGLHVPGSFRMKYAVVQASNVPLAAAASLNANFPPVFSNAAVDKDGTNRFWVTDGGTVDNRGIDALLFALRSALRQQKELGRPARFPIIHIIIADASAASIDYQQDRGAGSKFGAPEKLATQLMEELVFEIDELCRQMTDTSNQVRLHYLMMPNTLRMRGGLGTHWMLPQTVKLSDTTARDPAKAASVRVNSEVVRKLISELHQTNAIYDGKLALAQPQLTQWIEEDEHRTNWLTLVQELKERPSRKTMILEMRQMR